MSQNVTEKSKAEVKAKSKEKKKIYRVFAESQLYPILNEMGYTEAQADQFQKRRLLESLGIFLALMFTGKLLASWLYFGALIVPVVYYKLKWKSIKEAYRVWKFKRHLQFTKFMRLLIPYLKQSEGNASLYTIFNKILQRTTDENDRKNLSRLMSQMTSRPNDVQPFIDFANRSSGTDRSVLFMTTIFDFQHSSFDTSVIDELGKEASKELMIGIDEIVRFKVSRFGGYPSKVTYALLIYITGFALGVVGNFLVELFAEGLM